MKGCDTNQNTFDLAEDKFIRYNVFTCIDRQFKAKIKIQLFKFDDNNNVIFHEEKTINDFKSITLDSEISMVNFVVLKESNNFGYLTYRMRTQEKSFYHIFNTPFCEDIYENNVAINTITQISFESIIKEKNYDNGNIVIISKDPGLEVLLYQNYDK